MSPGLPQSARSHVLLSLHLAHGHGERMEACHHSGGMQSAVAYCCANSHFSLSFLTTTGPQLFPNKV
jgi:hypothetical protein